MLHAQKGFSLVQFNNPHYHEVMSSSPSGASDGNGANGANANGGSSG